MSRALASADPALVSYAGRRSPGDAGLAPEFSRIRRHLRLIALLYAVSFCTLVAVTCIVAACLLDWQLRFGPLTRLVLGSAIGAGLVTLLWKSLVRPALTAIPDEALALLIERTGAGWHNLLVTAVSVDRSGRTGSLEGEISQQAVHRLRSAEARSLVDIGRVQAMAAAALLTCAAGMIVFTSHQQIASVAINRYLAPFAGVEYPRTTHLRLLTRSWQPVEAAAGPLYVASDDTLTLYVTDREGSLPESLSLEIKHADGFREQRTLEPTRQTGPDGNVREVAIVKLLGERESLRFRVTGGDDREMRWHRVESVSPPALEHLQVEVVPPSYTGRSAEQLAPGVANVQSLVGSTINVEARADRPLAQAVLRIEGRRPRELKLSEDKRSFSYEVLLEQPGRRSSWLELTDEQGLQDRDPPRYELLAVADEPPQVHLELPVADGTVTPAAEIPIRAVARDDLGLDQVMLNVDDGEAHRRIVLERESGNSDVFEGTWSAAETGVAAGDVVHLTVSATDRFDLANSREARSGTRVVQVVSPDEKLEELAGAQAGLLGELERATEAQRAVREETAKLRVQADAARFSRSQAVALSRLEAAQRSVTEQLGTGRRSVLLTAASLLEQFEQNRFEQAEARRRLRWVYDELSALLAGPLPEAQSQFVAARKIADASGRLDSSDRQALASRLTELERFQSATVDSLELIADSLSAWRRWYDLGDRLDQIVHRQERTNDESLEIGKRTVSRTFPRLTPQEQAELRRAAQSQTAVAERFERLVEMLAQPVPVQQGSARQARWDRLTERLQEFPFAERMRAAAEMLGRNSIGRAIETQEELLTRLRSLHTAAQHGNDFDQETLVKQLTDAEQELRGYQARQRDAVQGFEQSLQDSTSDEDRIRLEILRKEQRDLADDVARLARRLRRLTANAAATTAARAAGRMEAADAQVKDLEQKRRSYDAASEALADLQQAMEEVRLRREQVEAAIQAAELASVVRQLRSLADRQEALNASTHRLQQDYATDNRWKRSRLATLRDLAAAQQDIRQQFADMAALIPQPDVFQFLVDKLQASFAAVTAAADDRELNQMATEQVRIPNGLRMLAAAVEPRSANRSAADNESTDKQSLPGIDDGESVRAAEVRLILSLQDELIERSAALQQVEDQQQKAAMMRELAAEQQRLYELTRRALDLNQNADSGDDVMEENP